MQIFKLFKTIKNDPIRSYIFKNWFLNDNLKKLSFNIFIRQ